MKNLSNRLPIQLLPFDLVFCLQQKNAYKSILGRFFCLLQLVPRIENFSLRVCACLRAIVCACVCVYILNIFYLQLATKSNKRVKDGSCGFKDCFFCCNIKIIKLQQFL